MDNKEELCSTCIHEGVCKYASEASEINKAVERMSWTTESGEISKILDSVRFAVKVKCSEHKRYWAMT